MSYLCPECQRLLYSRRLQICDYCDALIPESLRFTADEIAARDREIESSNERFRDRERAAEEEAAMRGDLGVDEIDPLDLL